MTLRILALALLTALANAQHPTPGAEPKPAAKRAPDAKPEYDAARARRLLALADLDGDGVISPRERQWVHMVLNQREHGAKENDGKPDAPKEGERARRAKEHADEVRQAKGEKREEARGKDAKKPPPPRVKQR
ncbi:MAG: hypothetical protein IPM13_18130 [Phycisphaerales bacterium]|nr:hypothetical protein [Phycisphaerales bacterium]